MEATFMINRKIHYFNTKTADHICGTWDDNTHTIKELHANKNKELFFAVYDEDKQNEYIKHTTPQEALSFIDECKQNKIYIKWFPGGKQILQMAINEALLKY